MKRLDFLIQVLLASTLCVLAATPAFAEVAPETATGGGTPTLKGIFIAPAAQTLGTAAFAPVFSGPPRELAAAPVLDRDRALECMTMAIAYEAGNEPVAGQQAVGQVILNRVRSGRFQSSVCGVVFAGSSRTTGCQFTFTCDGSLARKLREATLANARSVAETVLVGAAPDRVGGATHYHADYVNPYWASTGTVAARIGAHIFYRMPGDQPSLTAPVLAEGPEPELAPAQRLRYRPRPAMLAAAAPAAIRPMFAPWGLPVGGASPR